jgi:outer membrane immunogenic protein
MPREYLTGMVTAYWFGGRSLMKRLLLVAFAIAAVFAARPATSADLETAPVYQPLPPIVPVYSWTGCYLGGNVGTGWSTWTYSNPTDNPTRPGERGAILGNDVVAGGQVGCDYQGGAWVFGVQGMGDWTQIKGRFFDSTTGAFDESAQARWFATATGRVGVTMTPQALLYAKGGAAWVNNRYQDIQTGAFCGFGSLGCNQVDATTTTTRLGWTVGIGAEYMFAPNWSVFVEYDYMNFGNPSVNFTFPSGNSNAFNISQHIQTTWSVSTFEAISVERQWRPDGDGNRPTSFVIGASTTLADSWRGGIPKSVFL